MKPHYITCTRHSGKPDVIDYNPEPVYSEEAAREAVEISYPIGDKAGNEWVYSHTLFVRPGAHGRPVVEYIEFERPPAPKPEPGRIYSWN